MVQRKKPFCVAGLAFLFAMVAIPAQAGEIKLGPNERISPKDGVIQVYVPPGEFIMGVDDPNMPYENTSSPPHRVKITKGFWMDKFEITNERYVKYLNDSIQKDKITDMPRLLGFAYAMLDIGHPLCGIEIDEKNKKFVIRKGSEKLPVMPVTWTGAYQYCVATLKSLPTEAQWEYAARGPKNFKYPWGSDWHRDWANVATGKPAAVGSYPKDISPFGVMDMAGNVSEWALDKFAAGYYAESPSDDPLNWAQLYEWHERVIRGGGFALTEWDSRTTSRGHRAIMYFPVGTGFRCVEPGPPPDEKHT
jgi:formylglycine-generating enzyme required for sulfatase activity